MSTPPQSRRPLTVLPPRSRRDCLAPAASRGELSSRLPARANQAASNVSRTGALAMLPARATAACVGGRSMNCSGPQLLPVPTPARTMAIRLAGCALP